MPAPVISRSASCHTDPALREKHLATQKVRGGRGRSFAPAQDEGRPAPAARLLAGPSPASPSFFSESAEDHIASLALLLRIVKRSEEHTSELQSQSNLVCRLLLE